MNYNYEGKICVVTGAASGMGEACAKLLVEQGAKVYALDIGEIKVEGVEKKIFVDLSEKESIDKAFAEIPEHIDCYFGVAGVLGLAFPFIKTVKIDLISNKYICEEYLVNRMSEGGAIAFVSSAIGVNWEQEGNIKYYKPILEAEGWDGAVEAAEATGVTKLPNGLAYAFSKMAVNYYTYMAQSIFGPKKVRVNSICPGNTSTNFAAGMSDEGVSDEVKYRFSGYTYRSATSYEMAYPLVFVNSDLASFMSGAIIPVDGGSFIEIVAGKRPNPIGTTIDNMLNRR